MIYLVIGVIILFNTSVIPAPVRLSEKGILYTLPAALFIALSIRSFKPAVKDVSRFVQTQTWLKPHGDFSVL